MKHGEEFIIDTSYPGDVFVGWAAGRFKSDKGEKVLYANMFVLAPVSGYETEDCKAFGAKVEKKKCFSTEVWEDLEIGNRVKLLLGGKQRMVMVALDE